MSGPYAEGGPIPPLTDDDRRFLEYMDSLYAERFAKKEAIRRQDELDEAREEDNS